MGLDCTGVGCSLRCLCNFLRSEERGRARPGLGELVKSKTSPPQTPVVGDLVHLPQSSSLLLCSSVLPLQVSAQPTTPGLTHQASPSPASVPHSRLLLPGDFTGTGPGAGSTAKWVHLKPDSIVNAQVTPSTWDPSTQPWPSRKGGPDPACSVTKSHMDLEAELESIQKQLQDYQTMKQNLS